MISRECPNCGYIRHLTGPGSGSRKNSKSLRCKRCKKWTALTEAEAANIPPLKTQPNKTKGNPECPRCHRTMRKTCNQSEERYYCRPCQKWYCKTTVTGRATSAARSKSLQVNMCKTSFAGFRGVTFIKASGRYKARISKDEKEYYLGIFPTAIDAAIAYNIKALELYGPDAFQNDIYQKRDPKDYDYGTRGAPVPTSTDYIKARLVDRGAGECPSYE